MTRDEWPAAFAQRGPQAGTTTRTAPATPAIASMVARNPRREGPMRR